MCKKLLCVKTSLCKSPCVCKSFCASPPSSFLLGHAVVQFQSATLFLACGRMQRTCESIARLKIEHKQRTKCCNLQYFALSDGKNPRKYHSFSPRKWLKHCYLQGFVHVTIFRFFEKRVNTSVFLRSARPKNRFKKYKECCNLQGFGPVTCKKLCKYQRFGVQKLPKHRYLQCFVPATFC